MLLITGTPASGVEEFICGLTPAYLPFFGSKYDEPRRPPLVFGACETPHERYLYWVRRRIYGEEAEVTSAVSSAFPSGIWSCDGSSVLKTLHAARQVFKSVRTPASLPALLPDYGDRVVFVTARPADARTLFEERKVKVAELNRRFRGNLYYQLCSGFTASTYSYDFDEEFSSVLSALPGLRKAFGDRLTVVGPGLPPASDISSFVPEDASGREDVLDTLCDAISNANFTTLRRMPWICARSGTFVNDKVCLECLKTSGTSQKMKASPDWAESPCAWECAYGPEPHKTVEESIRFSNWEVLP